MPKPSYPLFEFLADLSDVKLVPYPLIYDHGWQIDFDSLYKAATPRSRAVIIVHSQQSHRFLCPLLIETVDAQ